MFIKIPEQLKDPAFRFIKIGRGSKRPIESQWPTINNYKYYEGPFLRHLQAQGNYGVVSSYGNLVMVDFDDKEYMESTMPQLPKTFTVQTAKSRLYHLYYILKGEPISKIGIDGKDGHRLADIQSNHAMVVGPGSMIDRRYYEIVRDVPISELSYDTLKDVFNVTEKEYTPKLLLDKEFSDPKAMQESVNQLRDMGLIQKRRRNFICPFHDHHNDGGNLTVLPDGALWCFHCEKYWKSPEQLRGILK